MKFLSKKKFFVISYKMLEDNATVPLNVTEAHNVNDAWHNFLTAKGKTLEDKVINRSQPGDDDVPQKIFLARNKKTKLKLVFSVKEVDKI